MQLARFARSCVKRKRRNNGEFCSESKRARAIFGLLGGLAVLVPYSKIYLLIGPLILLAVEFILGPFVPSSFQSFASKHTFSDHTQLNP